jgi:hypothetical protein
VRTVRTSIPYGAADDFTYGTAKYSVPYDLVDAAAISLSATNFAKEWSKCGIVSKMPARPGPDQTLMLLLAD